MSDRVWWFRLRDILDAIDFVSNHLEGVTYEEFEADEVLQRAILHTLEMAGEARRAYLVDLPASTPKYHGVV